MDKPVELPFPLGGVARTRQRGRQPEGTTDDALNVRAMDPVTGRVTGAQRPGLAPLVNSGENAAVTFLEDVPYQVDLIDYAQRTGDLVSTQYAGRVLTKGGGTVAAIAVDSEEQVYALDVQGEAVVVYSSELEEVQATIQLPLGNFDAKPRTLAVDDQQRVYVGAGNESGPSFGAVWRFDKQESGRYILGWVQEYPGDVVALRWNLGLLSVGVDTRDEEEPKSSVYFYSTAGGDPVEIWIKGMPYPVGDLDIDPDGNVLYTAPWYVGRRGLNEGFAERLVDAAPHEILGDVDGTGNRVFFHVCADSLDGFASGDKVNNWPDYRFDTYWTSDTQTNYAAQVDDTDRYLQRKAGVGWQEAPEYAANAFGPLPGVRFNGVQMIRSRANLQAQNKTTADEKLPKNRSIIPGVPGIKWATTLLLRAPESDEAQIIFASKGPLNFAVAWNAADDWDPDNFTTTGTKKGYVALYEGDISGAPVCEVAVSNDLDVILITVVHNGLGATDGEFRVNGSAPITFQWSEDKMAYGNSNNATVVVGRTRVEGSGTSADPFGPDVNLKGFEGSIREWITYLGGGATHGASITNAEIEDIEGYMAWASGCASVLPTIAGGHAHGSDGAPPPGLFTNANSSPYSGNQLALLDDKAVVAKLAAGGGSVAWAYNEYVGAGTKIRAGKDGTVITMGWREERWVDPSTGHVSPLIRSSVDNGVTVELGSSALARIRFVDQVVEDDTVTLDGRVYTFKTSPAAAWHVAQGADDEAAARNMAAAINLVPVTGSEYDASTHVYPNHAFYAEVVPEPNASPPTYHDLVVYSHLRGSWAGTNLTVAIDSQFADFTLQTPLTAGNRKDVGVWAYQQRAGALWTDTGWADLDNLSGMEVDEAGDVYFCRPAAETADYGTVPEIGGVEKVHRITDSDGDDGATTRDWYWWNGAYATAATGGNFENIDLPHNAIALAPRPYYGSNDEKITGPEFLYVATSGYKQDESWLTERATSSGFAGSNITRLRNVSAARAVVDSTRGHRRVAVINTKVFQWTPGGVPARVGIDTTMDADARRIVGAQLYGRVYLSDGKDAYFVDVREARIAAWKAEEGRVPERIQILEPWRGRLVAVDEKDPYNWHMSRLGDPLDWDYKPELITAEQAIEGNNARALGRLPEPITSVIPESDDVLLIGCQNSIHIMRGDPMVVALGGYNQRVIGPLTTEHGIAPGRAWTKDPSGNLYVLGSRGALLRIPRGAGAFDDISKGRIRRELEDVNWAQHYVELSWDYAAQGLHIIFVRFGGAGPQRQHWFWEEITGRWSDGYYGSFWPSEFAVEPTAVAQLDGDLPGQRQVVFGGADGGVYAFDPAGENDQILALPAVKDDLSTTTEHIHSRVLTGPVEIGPPSMDVGISNITTELGAERGGAEYSLYASQEPTRPDYPYDTGALYAGRNETMIRVARGAYVWMELANGPNPIGWSHERTVAEVHTLGLARRW